MNTLATYFRFTRERRLGAQGRLVCPHWAVSWSVEVGGSSPSTISVFLQTVFPSLGYVLQDLNPLPRLAARLASLPSRTGRHHYYLYPLAYLLSFVGLTERMTFWAQRVDA